MTSIYAGAHDDRHCKRDRVHMAGIPERIGTLKSLVVSRFKPQPPVWQASALSIGVDWPLSTVLSSAVD